MNIDQVIALGDISWWDGVKLIPLYYYLIPTILIFWGIAAFYKGEYYKVDYYWQTPNRKGKNRMTWGILLFVLVIVCGGMINVGDLIDDWKKNVAYPYIQSLPDEKDEIVYVKIETKIENRYGWYVFPHEHRLTPLTVSFKSGQGVETYTNWFDASMELSNETKPYIMLKRLHKDLGNDIRAGVYNPSVYLPSSYKFTDIK